MVFLRLLDIHLPARSKERASWHTSKPDLQHYFRPLPDGSCAVLPLGRWMRSAPRSTVPGGRISRKTMVLGWQDPSRPSLAAAR